MLIREAEKIIRLLSVELFCPRTAEVKIKASTMVKNEVAFMVVILQPLIYEIPFKMKCFVLNRMFILTQSKKNGVYRNN